MPLHRKRRTTLPRGKIGRPSGVVQQNTLECVVKLARDNQSARRITPTQRALLNDHDMQMWSNSVLLGGFLIA
jgi:hypothetical protein